MNLKAWILSVAVASVAASTSDSGSGSSAVTDAPLTAENLVSRPGMCSTTKDCDRYGTGYSCISVKSGLVGVPLLKQCVLGDGCSGGKSGPCPTFTSWPQQYRQVQPLCAFVAVPNCNTALNSQGQLVQVRNLKAEASKPGNVTCYQATFNSTDPTEKSVTVNGIYMCVDRTIYSTNDYGYLDNTKKQLDACAGNVTIINNQAVTPGLCNAHGTCAPSVDFSPTYKCLCSKGYSSDDNCATATGNICSAFGQCGNGNCDPKTGQCVCPPGSTGNQCSKCDPTQNKNESVTMCNGQGSCGVDGTCVCNLGYIGPNCAIKVKLNNTDSDFTDSSSTSAAVGLHEASIAIFSIATIVAAALI